LLFLNDYLIAAGNYKYRSLFATDFRLPAKAVTRIQMSIHCDSQHYIYSTASIVIINCFMLDQSLVFLITYAMYLSTAERAIYCPKIAELIDNYIK